MYDKEEKWLSFQVGKEDYKRVKIRCAQNDIARIKDFLKQAVLYVLKNNDALEAVVAETKIQTFNEENKSGDIVIESTVVGELDKSDVDFL